MKFFSLPHDMLDDLVEEEEEEEDDTEDKAVGLEEGEEGEQIELDAYGNPKHSTESPSLSRDYPAGSSVGVSSYSSGSSSRKSQSKKGSKDNGIKVITIKLDSLLQLSDGEDEEGEESNGRGEKSSLRNIFSKVLDHIMVSI